MKCKINTVSSNLYKCSSIKPNLLEYPLTKLSSPSEIIQIKKTPKIQKIKSRIKTTNEIKYYRYIKNTNSLNITNSNSITNKSMFNNNNIITNTNNTLFSLFPQAYTPSMNQKNKIKIRKRNENSKISLDTLGSKELSCILTNQKFYTNIIKSKNSVNNNNKHIIYKINNTSINNNNNITNSIINTNLTNTYSNNFTNTNISNITSNTNTNTNFTNITNITTNPINNNHNKNKSTGNFLNYCQTTNFQQKITKKSNKSLIEKPNQKSTFSLIVINILFKYKNNKVSFCIKNNNYYDGLWLAKKVDNFFNLKFNNDLMDDLATLITQQINNIITCIISNPEEKNFSALVDINKIINKNKEKEERNMKYKIVAKYGNNNYYYFVKNDEQEINFVVDNLISNLNKKEKYIENLLKKEVFSSIKTSIAKANNKCFITTENSNTSKKLKNQSQNSVGDS